MLLVVDIGNTNITLGVFENENLLKTFRLISDKNVSQKDYETMFKDVISSYDIKHCVIASVVEELNLIIKKTCDNVFSVDSYLINKTSDFGMKIKLPNQAEVGIDRLANAYGAKLKYKLPLIVVDIGTATTFDIVSKEGDFIGGVIMPGINLQLQSLNINTSKLPQVSIRKVENAIGDSTENAILSGVIKGSACAIEGLINQCEMELQEKATIVATGGQSSLLSEYLNRKFDYIDPDLTLFGIKNIYKLNYEKNLLR